MVHFDEKGRNDAGGEKREGGRVSLHRRPERMSLA